MPVLTITARPDLTLRGTWDCNPRFSTPRPVPPTYPSLFTVTGTYAWACKLLAYRKSIHLS